MVAPDNIKLLDNNGNLIANPGQTGVIQLGAGGRVTASSSSSGSITFQGVMINNGLSASGTDYEPLDLSITADVILPEQTVDFDYALPGSSGDNQTEVQNTADNTWTIQKTAVSTEPEITGAGEGALATFTYIIEAGKKVNGSLSGSASDYNKYGALNFTAGGFTLTEELPTFYKDSSEIRPQSSSITLLDSGLDPAPATSGGTGVTSLQISDYRTTSLDSAYATVGASPLAVETPFYSKYKVTVSYLLSDLTLPYDSPLEDDPSTFTLDNAATLDYTLVGTAAKSDSDDVSFAWKKTTPPGKLVIRKIIPFNETNQPYDNFWSTVFPGGAEFEIYRAADWDAGSGVPGSGKSPAAAYSLTVNDPDNQISLEPGVYYVLETDPPEGTEAGDPVMVTVVSGETRTADYVNAANYGLLTFKKLGANDAALSGARFALLKDGAPFVTADSNIDGRVYISAPGGAYQLVETYAPAGYVRMDPVDVTIGSGQTLDLGEIVDEASTASLTVSKYAVTYDNGGADYPSEDVFNIKDVANPSDFTFKLTWVEEENDVPTPYVQDGITLNANGTVTLS